MTPSPAAVRLGMEMRRLRMGRGMSQREFARALGLTAHSNLVQYELGRRIPPADIIDAYERMFGDGARSLRPWRAEALAARAPTPAPLPAAQAVSYPPRTAVPATLPAAIPDFTGRTAELRRLWALAQPAAPPIAPTVISIVGTAGVGKTALAVHFAHQIRERFPDGQLFVNLSGHARTRPRAPVQVLAGLLQSLGVAADRIPPDEEPAVNLYRSLVADRRILVVLDDAHDPAQVRPLLPASGGCLVVVTSRNRLTGLSARDGARRLTVDVLSAGESNALLATVLGTDRVAGEADSVAKLARACAHLPLALRIAAANLGNHPRQRIASYLAEVENGSRLAALRADTDDDAAVRVAFDLSYAVLSTANGVARLLFPYAVRLPSPSEPAAGTDPASASAWIVAELPNLIAAVRHAARYGPRPTAWLLADTLRPYFVRRVHTVDWMATAHAALRATEAASDLQPRAAAELSIADCYSTQSRYKAAIGRYTRVVGLARRCGWTLCEGAALLHMGNAYAYSGRPQAAADHYARALGLSRPIGTPVNEARCLNNLGDAYQNLGRLTEAAGHCARALTLHRQAGYRQGVAIALQNLGMLCHLRGEPEHAIDRLDQALAINRECGDMVSEAFTLISIAAVHRDAGRDADALRSARTALDLTRESVDPRGETYALNALGAICHRRGLDGDATAYHERALDRARRAHDRRSEIESLLGLAGSHVRRRPDLAHSLARQANGLARRHGYRLLEGDALTRLAETNLALGRARHATRVARQALDVHRTTGYRLAEARTLLVLGEALDAGGEANVEGAGSGQGPQRNGPSGEALPERPVRRTAGHAGRSGNPSQHISQIV